MKTTAALTVNDTAVSLVLGHRTLNLDAYEATVFLTGTFGGGTVSLQASPDGGTTKVNLKDLSGVTIAATASDVFNIRCGFGNKNGEDIRFYATVTGATDPIIDVTVFDNR